MKSYQFFLKGFSLFLLIGCATFTPSQKTLDDDPNKVMDYTKIRNLYCSGNKQVKDFKFSFSEKKFKIAPGIPVSEVSKFKSNLEKGRLCGYKKILYELTKTDSIDHKYFEVSQDDFKELEATGVGSIDPESFRANCRLQNLFIRAPGGKVNLYRASLCSSAEGGTFYSGTGLKLNFFNSYPIRIPYVTILVDQFTIIEPIEFQNGIYKEDNCHDESEKTYGYNEEGSFDAELSLDYRDQIWKRYITHFTSIKESQSDDSISVELALDLNPFCRYGRNVQDLKSK